MLSKFLITISVLFSFSYSVMADKINSNEANPLSVIDWLSEAYAPDKKKIKLSTTLSPPLENAFFIENNTLLHKSWEDSNTEALEKLISILDYDVNPELLNLIYKVLISEMGPANDSISSESLLLIRVNKLIEFGAIEQAQTLLESANPNSSLIFERLFDLSLITYTEETTCDRFLNNPSISSDYKIRIFCLARAGNWQSAETTLHASFALNLISTENYMLLMKFLAPENVSEHVIFIPIGLPTFLQYRILEAIGEKILGETLPNSFAHFELSQNTEWKGRILASERLIRTGALPFSQLLNVYQERQLSKSGGVWERVRLINQLEKILTEGSDLKKLSAFEIANTELISVDLHGFALTHYTPILLQILKRIQKEPVDINALIKPQDLEAISMLNSLSNAEQEPTNVNNSSFFSEALTVSDHIQVLDNLTGEYINYSLRDLISQDKRGEALLLALNLLKREHYADETKIKQGLKLLLSLGYSKQAEKTALFISEVNIF
ncbi:MAG: hypothetical protein ACI8Y9_000843 [Paracoccaceae bacterium]|jgi:hypothetical protein